MPAVYRERSVRIIPRATQSPADSMAGSIAQSIFASEFQSQPAIISPRSNYSQSSGNTFVGALSSQSIFTSTGKVPQTLMQAVPPKPQQVRLGNGPALREQAMMPVETLLEEQHSAVKKALALTRTLADRLKTLDEEGEQSCKTLALKLRPREDSVNDPGELVEQVTARPEGEAQAKAHLSTSGSSSETLAKPSKAMWTPRKSGQIVHALTVPLIEPAGRSTSSTSITKASLRGQKQHPPRARIDRIAQAEDHISNVMSRSRTAREKSMLLHHSHSFIQDGFFAMIAKSHAFELITFFAIILNAIWIAIETDFNKFEILCEAPMVYQIIDNAFCSYFTWEIIVRIMADTDKAALWTEGSFLFDVACLSAMVWECWIQVLFYYMDVGMSAHVPKIMFLRIFRVVKGTRMLRAGKILMYLPELNILAKGIMAALRSVVSTLLALSLLIYCFGILFTQMLSDEAVGKDRFETVPMSLNFFLMQFICGVDSIIIMELLRLNWLYYVLFLIFVFVGSLTIMNMLVGVVVDTVASVGEAERARVRREKLDDHIRQMVGELDMNRNGMVEFSEFEEMFQDPDKLMVLKDLGVDLVAFLDFTRFTFPEEGFTVKELQRLLRMLMDNKPTTVKDMLEIQHAFSMELVHLEERILARLQPADSSKQLARS